MKKYRIKTLQQKTAILVLLPTFLLLTAVGWGGFVFAKKSLLMQWGETAVANLQKAAHLIDMRLSRPKDLLLSLEYSSGAGMMHIAFRYTIEKLQELDGVKNVEVKWHKVSEDNDLPNMQNNMPFYPGPHTGATLSVTAPAYTWEPSKATIFLISQLADTEGNIRGNIEIEIDIADITEHLAKSNWWKSNKTLLMDTKGNVITHSAYEDEAEPHKSGMKFGQSDPLEKQTLIEIQDKLFGTIFGKGNPPGEISGFYRLADPPWYMVVMAPGETVLEPILKFRLYYVGLFASAILILIAFIRSMTTKMTSAIQQVSIAAENLASGVFGPPLPIQSGDEIGELTLSFNRMTSQLKQGLELQKAMEIAREVQQNFLPSSRYAGDRIDICGASRYCQETGGDFFDLVYADHTKEKVGAIVGDVVGHGIGAALLMASVRAMLRSRNEQSGDIATIVTDVNRVLCRDTEASSNFVTLFYITIDLQKHILNWVRAGHDPALLYYPERDVFVELRGRGVAMGVDRSLQYEINKIEMTKEKQLIVIGSDGAWEAENREGEVFGKKRLREILKNNNNEHPEIIIKAINDKIDLFLDGKPPQDDITFMIIKINGLEI